MRPREVGVWSPGTGWIYVHEKVMFNSQFVRQKAGIIIQTSVAAGPPAGGRPCVFPPGTDSPAQAVAEADPVPAHELLTGKNRAPVPRATDHRGRGHQPNVQALAGGRGGGWGPWSPTLPPGPPCLAERLAKINPGFSA